MIQSAQFVFNDFQENTYVAWDETSECVIIDPGCATASEQNEVVEFIAQNGLKPVKVLNTHCHIDHILGNHFLCDRYDIPLLLHREELKTYEHAPQWATMFGIALDPIPDTLVYIDEKDRVTFGISVFHVAFTPGHSIASLTFYNPGEKKAFSGDVLFYESIGRTDLPGGDYATLIRSIKEKMMIWEDDMQIFSGHGPATTIGHERKFNPFLI